jgi:predicted dinucleotide-binding enzyme
MKAGIIGAGNIGSALAVHFKKLGYDVVIANSRGPHTLEKEAERTKATPVEIGKVAIGADLLVITIPMKAVAHLSAEILSSIPRNAIVIDTCNYYPLRDGNMEEFDSCQITESTWIRNIVKRTVIKVFNSIIAESLLNGGLPKGSKNRIALPISGDDDEAKKKIIDLVDQMGFDGVDAGTLAESWRQQPGAPTYCVDANKQEMPPLLEKADWSKSHINREKEFTTFANLPPDFPYADLIRAIRSLSGLDVEDPKTKEALVRIGWADK